MILSTEVHQCASSVIPVHRLTREQQQALLADINTRFLLRQDPAEIQRMAHIQARQQAIQAFRPDITDGLVVVGFAGGGGSCEGIKQALGYEPHIAMNHNHSAMAMHAANHPKTLHYEEDIFSVDPVISTGGIPVMLAWFSPDCRDFSKAKGGTPVKKEIRGLAWVVIRWALDVRPRVLMLENVEEFRQWGPLRHDKNGNLYPDEKRRGETFGGFIAMLTRGIPADHPALAECCEFLKISANSPEAEKLINGLGYTVDHRELRACDYGAPTIRKRLFVVGRCDGLPVTWPEPTHGAPDSAEVKAGQRSPWRTAAECIDWSIPCPSIFERKKPLAENTLRRIARGIQRFVIDNPEPFIVKCNHTSTKTVYDCFRGQSLGKPLQTVTQTHGYALVAPVITRQFGNSVGHDISAPNGTITSGGGGKSQLVTAIIVGTGGPKYQANPKPCNKPLNTVVATSRQALVTAFLAKHYGGGPKKENAGVAMRGPLHTVTTIDHHALVTAFITKYYGGGPEKESDGVATNEPLHTVTVANRHALVTVKGVEYQIADIGMRMLQPRELFNAQGFPPDYIIDQDIDGNRSTKSEQVARCGNAVPPPFAAALVRANLPEFCGRGE